MASTGVFGDDEERIKETLRKASDEKLIREWSNCVKFAPDMSGVPPGQVQGLEEGAEQGRPRDRSDAQAGPRRSGEPVEREAEREDAEEALRRR
ncbi:MAG: hypothetical protein IPQ07_28190 [Myxococcales bacterium]|nr:hypothetical protein [Myxococcales bacterium]